MSRLARFGAAAGSVVLDRAAKQQQAATREEAVAVSSSSSRKLRLTIQSRARARVTLVALSHTRARTLRYTSFRSIFDTAIRHRDTRIATRGSENKIDPR